MFLKQLKAKYVCLSQPAKASLWFLICGFLQKGISFLTTPVFTRVMAETEYGRFSVYNSWLGIFQIVLTLNLAAGVYTRGLIKNESDQARFSSSLLGLSTACMTLGAAVHFIFHNELNALTGMSATLTAGMLLEIWGTVSFQFWSNRERVHYRYKKLAALTVLYVFLRPLLGVVFVICADIRQQTEARVLGTVIANIALFSPLYIATMKKGGTFFHKAYWTYALKFNLPLIPHYLSQIVLSQSDRLMINYFCGSAEAGYYSVAYSIAMVLRILNNSVSATMNPWIYRTIKHGDTDEIGRVSYLTLILIAGSNLLVAASAPELMKILAPASYQSAVWVVPSVTVSVYFMFLYNLFATFEYYYDKTGYVMLASLCGAVLNIILNAVFIPKYGFLAAGYTTLLCYIIYAAMHYFFMKKVCAAYMEGRRIYNLGIILAIGGALLLGAFVMLLFYHAPAIRYGILLCLVSAAYLKRTQIFELFDTIRKQQG